MSEDMIFAERREHLRLVLINLKSKLIYDDYNELEKEFENFITYVENEWIKKDKELLK